MLGNLKWVAFLLSGGARMKELMFILLGVLAGSASGLFGIGGGIVLVPALIFLAGYTQHEAQGTTLAVLQERSRACICSPAHMFWVCNRQLFRC